MSVNSEKCENYKVKPKGFTNSKAHKKKLFVFFFFINFPVRAFMVIKHKKREM